MRQVPPVNGFVRICHAIHYGLIAVAVMVISLTACTVPPTQPVSPPPAVINSPLLENRWRIETVIREGQNMPIEAAAPLYIVFERRGGLHVYSDKDQRGDNRCGSVWHPLEYLEGQRFRIIGPGLSNAARCPEPQATQFWSAGGIFRVAYDYEYEVSEEALLVRSEDAEIRAVLDNP